jgi:hypothetical protein
MEFGVMNRNLILRAFAVFCCVHWSTTEARSDIVTFGSGNDTFDLTFKAVLNEGNAADSTNFGSVSSGFGMSKYEISERMIDIYNLNQTTGELKISYYKADNTGYGPNKAAANMTWVEAARFVNWLNISHGFAPAYRFRFDSSSNITTWQSSQVADYDPLNPFRSKRAVFALPTIDEWYKAAFYDPALNGTGGYWEYAVRSNNAPNAVISGTGATDVVYRQGADGSPADITQAGGLSAYGVMGMNGNVWEWTESPLGGVFNVQVARYFVGGGWAQMQASEFQSSGFTPELLLSELPGTNIPQGGFRVISLVHTNGGDDGGFLAPLSTVPEPASGMFLLLVTATGFRTATKAISRRNHRSVQQH